MQSASCIILQLALSHKSSRKERLDRTLTRFMKADLQPSRDAPVAAIEGSSPGGGEVCSVILKGLSIVELDDVEGREDEEV